MKKLAVLAAVALVCGTANAAIISWGAASGVSAFGAWYSSGDYVALVWDSAGDGIDPVNPANGFVAGDDVIAMSGALSATINYASGNKTVTPGSVFAGVTTSGVTPYTVFNNLYVVVYDSSSAATVQHYLVSTAKGSFTVNTSPVPASMNRTTWTQFTPIPEPTTMALALLGAGVLAIRRRMRK